MKIDISNQRIITLLKYILQQSNLISNLINENKDFKIKLDNLDLLRNEY